MIGVNTAINTPSGGSVGIGFAVPSSVVARGVPELIKNGRYDHPLLAVQVLELGADVKPPTNGPSSGLLVIDILAGSGAAQSDLQTSSVQARSGRYVFTGGDIITALNDDLVKHRDDLLIAIDNTYRPGDKVMLTVQHLENDGQWRDHTIPVQLDVRR